jgi:hypothetical protein
MFIYFSPFWLFRHDEWIRQSTILNMPNAPHEKKLRRRPLPSKKFCDLSPQFEHEEAHTLLPLKHRFAALRADLDLVARLEFARQWLRRKQVEQVSPQLCRD